MEQSRAKIHLEKIVVNTGFGRLTTQANFKEKTLPAIIKELAAITGQHPETRPAKKSIAGFKLRAGEIVGLRVTLRGRRLLLFLDKVIKAVIPRIRDFRGIDLQNVDEHGNLNIGVRDQFVFPEVNPETSPTSFGIQITVVPKGLKNREAALDLYRSVGVPFKK